MTNWFMSIDMLSIHGLPLFLGRATRNAYTCELFKFDLVKAQCNLGYTKNQAEVNLELGSSNDMWSSYLMKLEYFCLHGMYMHWCIPTIFTTFPTIES